MDAAVAYLQIKHDAMGTVVVLIPRVPRTFEFFKGAIFRLSLP